MITRFFAGFFGSAPVTNTGGVLGDIWTAEQRGAAIVGYAMVVVGGLVIGPIAGGAIMQSYLHWRWTEYITGILIMFFLLLDILFLNESYLPVLLVYKAQRLHFKSSNWALHAHHKEWDVTFKEIANKYLVRPFKLLATPICFLMALYTSFVYGIIYLSGGLPHHLPGSRGWNQVVGALPFLAMLIGIFFSAAANLINQHFYITRYKANNNFPVPEARLRPMMLGSVFFASGLFVFAWTGNYPSIYWICPIVCAALMGLGFFTIFQAALNYLINTFQQFAASAVAANTFFRSIFAGSFPLFAQVMFHRLGVGWAGSVLGFVAILIPIPFLFYIFGKRIRARGLGPGPKPCQVLCLSLYQYEYKHLFDQRSGPEKILFDKLVCDRYSNPKKILHGSSRTVFQKVSETYQTMGHLMEVTKEPVTTRGMVRMGNGC